MTRFAAALFQTIFQSIIHPFRAFSKPQVQCALLLFAMASQLYLWPPNMVKNIQAFRFAFESCHSQPQDF